MDRPVRLDELLRDARARGVERLDAELLAAFVLQMPRARIIARPEQPLDPDTTDRLRRLLARRAAGEPFAHLTGARSFHALDLRVTADVLVPRPDTERLVDAVLERRDEAPRTVLDLGTGSGAIALALAAARRAWQVTATDRSAAALAVAADNAARLGLAERVTLQMADWYEGLPPDRRDIIVSNPPYIAPDDPELDPDVLRHEPRAALLSGSDGLDALRRVIGGAPARLVPGGLLAVEHGHRQGEAVRSLAHAAGLVAVVTLDDLAGRPRVTCAEAPADAGTARTATGPRPGP